MVCYRHNNVWHIIHSINLKPELFPPFSLPLQLVLIHLFLWLSLLRGIPPLTICCQIVSFTLVFFSIELLAIEITKEGWFFLSNFIPKNLNSLSVGPNLVCMLLTLIDFLLMSYAFTSGTFWQLINVFSLFITVIFYNLNPSKSQVLSKDLFQSMFPHTQIRSASLLS